MRIFGQRIPKRRPKVVPPESKRKPPPDKSEQLKPLAPKYYIPPERTFPRRKKLTPTKRRTSNPSLKPPEVPKLTSILQPKTVAKTNDPEKEFLRIFKRLTYANSPWSVWQDFVILFACAISNSVDKTHYDVREQLYLKTIEKYDTADQELFSLLIPQTVEALDQDPEQDFLGHIFMTLELGQHAKGQYFTPYGVCKLMAAINLENVFKQVEEKGYCTIHDPCCGAGATLIAGINESREQLAKAELNFQNHVFVVGQDIDHVVALMCYIQISLLGVAGYVKVGNSLTDPITSNDSMENYWFTPIYFSDTWATRRLFGKISALFES